MGPRACTCKHPTHPIESSSGCPFPSPLTTRASLPFHPGHQEALLLAFQKVPSTPARSDSGTRPVSLEARLPLLQAPPFTGSPTPQPFSPASRRPPWHSPHPASQTASKAQHTPHFRIPGPTFLSQTPVPPVPKAQLKCLHLLGAFSGPSYHPQPRMWVWLSLKSCSLFYVVFGGTGWIKFIRSHHGGDLLYMDHQRQRPGCDITG